MRRILPAIGLVAAALLASALAWGDFSIRPIARWFADDQTIGFGNTSASPDVACGWETTGAEDHLACVIPTAAGLIVSSDADVDRSGVIAAGATYLGVCSDDAAAPTECLTFRHDGTDGIAQIVAGSLRMVATGEEYHRGAGDTSGVDTFDIVHGMTGRSAAFWLAEGTSNSDAVLLSASFAFDQVLMGLNSARGGFQLILGSGSFYANDHDHAAPATPTLFFHDATNPDTDNTFWGSITQNGTELLVGGGAGTAAFRFDGTNDLLSVGPDSNDVDIATGGAGITYSGTARPTHVFFLSPQEFFATTGTPAVAAYNGRPAMAFDGAANEIARAVWIVPSCYANGTAVVVTLLLSAGAAATRDVVIGTQFHSVADSEQLVVSGITENTLTTYAVDIADDLDTATSPNFNLAGATIAGGESLMFGFRRDGSDVADTLNSVDLQLLGVQFTITVDEEC